VLIIGKAFKSGCMLNKGFTALYTQHSSDPPWIGREGVLFGNPDRRDIFHKAEYGVFSFRSPSGERLI